MTTKRTRFKFSLVRREIAKSGQSRGKRKQNARFRNAENAKGARTRTSHAQLMRFAFDQLEKPALGGEIAWTTLTGRSAEFILVLSQLHTCQTEHRF